MIIRSIVTCIIVAFLLCQPRSKGIYNKPDSNAEFPGGQSEMYKFIGRNMRYPEAATRPNVSSGRIQVSFTVRADGRLQRIRVLEDPGYGVIAELLKVIKRMPPWKPAIKDGKPRDSTFKLVLWIDLE